jgi:FecR protein
MTTLSFMLALKGPIMRAHISAVLLTGAILAGGSILSSPAWTQTGPSQDVSVKPIGKVVQAKGSVTIEHVNPVVVQAALNPSGLAKVGDPVFLGDIVQTGADGRMGIGFVDGTAFDISSNASMVLNEFVYDPNSKSNSTVFDLSKGAFTFVAGNVAKTGDMKINTPVATMGIRGTTPHVEILPDGTVKISSLLEEGKADVLKKNGPLSVTPSNAGAAKPFEKLDLNICRGC